MSKGDRRNPRQPATKLPHLQKKLRKQQAQGGPRHVPPRKPRSNGST